MRNPLDALRAFRRKFRLHSWLDRLDLDSDAKNMRERTLRDAGLMRGDRSGPTDPVFFL
jgi:hypothetical protein